MIMIENMLLEREKVSRARYIVCELYAVMHQIIGVSHKYYRKYHTKNAKKHWFVYFYNEIGVFCVKRCNKLQALYYKTRIKKGVTMYCLKCSNSFIVYEKNAVCPYCE